MGKCEVKMIDSAQAKHIYFDLFARRGLVA